MARRIMASRASCCGVPASLFYRRNLLSLSLSGINHNDRAARAYAILVDVAGGQETICRAFLVLKNIFGRAC